MSSEARGLLFVVSSPSGAGKTTVVRRVVAETPGIRISRSYTSRQPRGSERHGVEYNFLTRGEFEAMVATGQFLEHAEVFGQLYGTSAPETEAVLAAGEDLVLVIDVQGAAKVRLRGVPSVGIFLVPPSVDALEARLRGRGEDAPNQIRSRLEVARREVAVSREYDYLVVNDDLEACVAEVRGIVLAERARTARRRGAVDRLLAEFRARGFD